MSLAGYHACTCDGHNTSMHILGDSAVVFACTFQNKDLFLKARKPILLVSVLRRLKGGVVRSLKTNCMSHLTQATSAGLR